MPEMSKRSWLIVLVLPWLAAWPAAARGEPVIRRVTVAARERTAAVEVRDQELVHTTQLFPAPSVLAETSGLPRAERDAAQWDSLLGQLDTLLKAYNAHRTQLVKLNFYVTRGELRELVIRRVTAWCGGADKLPATSFVTTALPSKRISLALDAVFAVAPGDGEERANGKETLPRRRRLPPLGRDARQSQDDRQSQDARRADACRMPRGDAVYIAGQAEPGTLAEATRGTLESLLRTLDHLGLDRRHVVQLKCFLRPMSDVEEVDRQIAEFFGEGRIPPVSHVEWISGSLPIEIELVAFAPSKQSEQTVTFETPPWMKSSPVFSRVARIHGDRRIYISGLYAESEGAGRESVENIFAKLQKVLPRVSSDIRHLAKATYYVSSDEASRALNDVRPSIYDPERPPAASKAMVRGVGRPGRDLTLDMIAAPSR